MPQNITGAGLSVFDPKRHFFLFAQETLKEKGVPHELQCRALVQRIGITENCGCMKLQNERFCRVHERERLYLRRKKAFAERQERTPKTIHDIVLYREILRSLFADDDEGHITAIKYVSKQEEVGSSSVETKVEADDEVEEVMQDEIEGLSQRIPKVLSVKTKPTLSEETSTFLDEIHAETKMKRQEGERKRDNLHSITDDQIMVFIDDSSPDMHFVKFFYKRERKVINWNHPVVNFDAPIKQIVESTKLSFPIVQDESLAIFYDESFIPGIQEHASNWTPVCLFDVESEKNELDQNCLRTTALHSFQVNVKLNTDYHCLYNSLYGMYVMIEKEIIKYNKKKLRKLKFLTQFEKMFDIAPDKLFHDKEAVARRLKNLSDELIEFKIKQKSP